MKHLYVGLMAGTSLDGVDAVLAEIVADHWIRVCGWHWRPFDPETQRLLQRCCFTEAGPLRLLGELDARLGELFGQTVLELLAKTGLDPSQIRAIGSHGQTLHHGPTANPPYTLQIGDPNRIAEVTGITTVADFRRRDIAAGGQGAPLVPAFHQALFRSPEENRAVLNLGGIANLTLLPADSGQPVTGFDTGPGNTLLNAWVRRHLGKPWDDGGRWARQGHCHRSLLEQLLNDPYFRRPPPKSTGPEYFSLPWLEKHLDAFSALAPVDVQATLTHLTAASIAQELGKAPFTPQRLLVCGGGVHNTLLLDLLGEYCSCPVTTTAAFGIDPDQVEALAFAWLAHQTLEGRPGNLPAVTGARREVILGAVYPG